MAVIVCRIIGRGHTVVMIMHHSYYSYKHIVSMHNNYSVELVDIFVVSFWSVV